MSFHGENVDVNHEEFHELRADPVRAPADQAPPPANGQNEQNIAPAAPVQQIAAAKKVKLPVFWKNDPELWFGQVEARFCVTGVTLDEEKYYLVVSAIEDPDVLGQVADIIRSPPATGKYNFLRTNLISRFSESKERQINRLLSEMKLDGKKPSHLLRDMRNLATASVPDAMLKPLWMQRMPSNVRLVLTGIGEDVDLNKLADIADRIMEQFNIEQAVSAINTVPLPKVSAQTNDAADKFKQLGQELIQAITESFAKLGRERSRSRSINRRASSRSRSRTFQSTQRTPNSSSEVCYYHGKFGENARNCRAPCNFNSGRDAQP